MNSNVFRANIDHEEMKVISINGYQVIFPLMKDELKGRWNFQLWTDYLIIIYGCSSLFLQF